MESTTMKQAKQKFVGHDQWKHEQKQARFVDPFKEVIENFVKEATPVLPTEPAERKAIPVGTGVLDYFPNALAEIAKISKKGNDQHNPGQPLHWARGKSMDHYDTMIRHSMERGTIDTDGCRHSAKMAWRALALLQEELEAAGAPLARGSKHE
jgi:hypothetical protein